MDTKTEQQFHGGQLTRYVELTNRVRVLSSPLLESVSNAEEYRVRLLENFRSIGDIAQENNSMLEDAYYPLIHSEDALSDEILEDMRAFAGAMFNAFTLENLDIPMLYLQAKRILADAKKKGETGGYIRALDEFIMVTYAMTNSTLRLLPCYDISMRFREEGMQAIREILNYLEPDRFLALPDAASRESVLINSRYVVVFFAGSWEPEPREVRQHHLDLLERALALYDDPFYRKHAPEYDWEYHRFRTLEYISRQSEHNNEQGYDPDQLSYIREKSREYISCVKANPERFSRFASERMLSLQSVRDDYLTGAISPEAYKKQLRDIMEHATGDESRENRLEQFFVIPDEYIKALDPAHLSADEKNYLSVLYKRMVVSMHQLRKQSISFMLTHMTEVLFGFIEVEGGMTFEDMALSLMVALHPPTYVHTLSVAGFAVCIAGHLIDRMPDAFIGFMGITSAEEAVNRREEILDFTRHAALCHDIGKLLITETIIMYGRRLYQTEFELIRMHPVIGAYHLEKHNSTKRYANIARGHHRWYDDSDGYPSDFHLNDCEDKTIIHTVTVADCLDAATDAVGRSYKKGKTLDDFLEELCAGSGTRYAPYLVELLSVPEVKEDLSGLLVSCRDENYRRAFRLLEELERQSA